MNPHHGYGTILIWALFLPGLWVSFGNHPGAALAQSGEPKAKADTTDVTPPPKDANDLSMEVNALRTLYLLRGTDQASFAITPLGRLNDIKKSYSSCAQKEKKRKQADISDAYRKVLVEFRAAIIAEQDEQIEKLDKQLQELQKEEDPELDDRVDITDEARKKAPEFVRNSISANQVATYLASYGKDFPNPRNLLWTTMRVTPKGVIGEKPSLDLWKKIRAYTIREVAWQVEGLNVAKGNQTGMQVGALLDKAYAMSDEELKTKNSELRKVARVITDKVGPTDLLKHVIEQDMAEMLSNPRLIPAAEACLKYLEAKKKQ